MLGSRERRRPLPCQAWWTPSRTVPLLHRHPPRLTFRRASRGVSTRPLPSGGAVARPACNPLWAPQVTASIMPCANRSSAHSNRSYSRANTSTPTSRPDAVSSGSSRAGTTCAAYIAASATVHRSNSKTCTQKNKSRRHAGCPPSGGVVVVIGDQPPARGQPATQRSMEAKPSICRNCRSVRRSGATSLSAGRRRITPPSSAVFSEPLAQNFR
jgi:hypothetical protein